jgi:citrate lyase beta subunit
MDSINTHLEKVLTLERKKHAEQDSIIVNLEDVIKKHEKSKKREKLKNVFIQIGAGLVIAAETGIITYLILR